MKRDNIHYSFRKINGYPQPFKFIISPREPGKSTSAEIEIANANYRKGGVTIYLKRQVVDITEAYIESFEEMNNKFDDVPQIHLVYNKSSLKDGIVKIYNEETDSEGHTERKLYIVLIALSIKVSRMKSLCFPNIMAMVFDEFICNPKMEEKYLSSEFSKWQELYNTLQRECPRLRCYWLGNPYSLFNPYFVGFGIDTSQLYQGAIYVKDNCVVECYQLTEELKEHILKSNPLYEFDDSYRAYAFDGRAINDENIQIETHQPKNFSLKFVFRIDNKFIGVYKGDLASNMRFYWCDIIDSISAKRTAFCFDFKELISHCALMSYEDRNMFSRFKQGVRCREVYFSSIECYYLLEEIYYNL